MEMEKVVKYRISGVYVPGRGLLDFAFCRWFPMWTPAGHPESLTDEAAHLFNNGSGARAYYVYDQA